MPVPSGLRPSGLGICIRKIPCAHVITITYVSMCIQLCISTYMHLYMCMCTCMLTMYAHTYVCVHKHMYVCYVHTYIRINSYVFMCACIKDATILQAILQYLLLQYNTIWLRKISIYLNQVLLIIHSKSPKDNFNYKYILATQ